VEAPTPAGFRGAGLEGVAIMKRCTILILALGTLCGGCATTHRHTVLDDAGRHALNGVHPRRTATIVLDNGTRIDRATRIRVTDEETSWYPRGGILMQSVPNDRVREVIISGRGRNAAKGMLNGLLIGAVAGALVGASDDSGMAGRSGSALAGGVVFGGLGAFTGLLVGLSDAETHHFVNEVPPAVKAASRVPLCRD